jgi:hypothetical protein
MGAQDKKESWKGIDSFLGSQPPPKKRVQDQPSLPSWLKEKDQSGLEEDKRGRRSRDNFPGREMPEITHAAQWYLLLR